MEYPEIIRCEVEMEARKRYVCPVCGSEVVIMKSSEMTIECHGKPLELRPVQTAASSARSTG